jgi:hypothetical protein
MNNTGLHHNTENMIYLDELGDILRIIRRFLKVSRAVEIINFRI